MHFYQEYQSVPTVADPLQDLAAEYHERTEAFDQAHCEFFSKRGVAIPRTTAEILSVGHHAKQVFHELQAKANQCGFTNEQWQKAVTSAATLSNY